MSYVKVMCTSTDTVETSFSLSSPCTRGTNEQETEGVPMPVGPLR